METANTVVERRAGASSYLGAVPRLIGQPRVALAGITAAAFVLWAVVAVFGASSPWIFPDELIYSDLAKSIASGGVPAVRGATELGYGLVYPGLLSPAWLIWHHVASAYLVARLINAAVMASTAIPAYLLARRFVRERQALLVALLSVLVPSMAYVATLLTEVALYPAYLWALWAIARALERPTRSTQCGALVAIGIAFATKSLMVVLIPTYVSAILLRAWIGTADTAVVRRELRKFSLTWLLVVATTAVGRSPFSVLGAYAVVIHHLGWSRIPRLALDHLSLLSLYVLVIPLAATVLEVARGFAARQGTAAHRFATLALPALLWPLLTVAAYGSKSVAGATGFEAATPLRERNVFFVVPLLFVGLALWTEDKRPRSRWAVLVAVCAGPALLAAFRFSLIPSSSNPQDLAAAPWAALPFGDAGKTALLVAVGSVAAAMWLGAHPDRRRTLWLLTGTWLAVTGFVACVIFHGASVYATRDGRGVAADWIDAAAGPGGHVSVLWRESDDGGFAPASRRQRVVWVSEFFNRSVGDVYSLGARLPFGLPATDVHARADGVLVDRSGKPVRADFLLAPCEVRVEAPALAVDRRLRAAVYRVRGPVRLGGPSVCTKGQ
jgi:hypothetical protein